MMFAFFGYLLLFQRYSSFCSKINDVINCLNTKINHKIKNISGNFGVMLLKLIFYIKIVQLEICLQDNLFSPSNFVIKHFMRYIFL